MDFEEYDTIRGIVGWPDNYFQTIVEDYLAAGNGRTGKVGAADSYLLNAVSLTDFGTGWMEENFNGKARQQAD
jgi:aminoglycoside 3-N-acetyltransferase